MSKQSTGLVYPNAFNWPKTINDNLIADSSIKIAGQKILAKATMEQIFYKEL
ncbi:MAG: hypothetical protein J6583_12210 [Gilliamella sp.]|nr:hypothetical protein [Gilliamella sp.]